VSRRLGSRHKGVLRGIARCLTLIIEVPLFESMLFRLPFHAAGFSGSQSQRAHTFASVHINLIACLARGNSALLMITRFYPAVP
jgi:hypothetical protein